MNAETTAPLGAVLGRTATHPRLHVARWLHLVNDLHFLPQNVALAVVADFLARLQGEDEHDDESDGDQEAGHHGDGLEREGHL